MRKKATTSIQLILITSVLASCNQSAPTTASNTQRVYMRADTTAPYTDVTSNYQQGGHSGMGGMGTALLWYMAFRHLGGRNGYSNNSLHPNSVVGNNAAKSQAYQTQRGGFGKNATNSSSSSTGS